MPARLHLKQVAALAPCSGSQYIMQLSTLGRCTLFREREDAATGAEVGHAARNGCIWKHSKSKRGGCTPPRACFLPSVVFCRSSSMNFCFCSRKFRR